MLQTPLPEGYRPYRLFEYDDGTRHCIIRPEHFIGAAIESTPSLAEPPWDEWSVRITLRDSAIMTLRFGSRSDGFKRAQNFVGTLRQFLEGDALRNAHNAAAKRSRADA